MISEKGSIEGNGSIRLLLSVHQLKHTGILYMKKEDVLKVLYFNRGRLLWAISNAGEDQLETVLIRHGVVKAEGLRAVKDGLPVNESIGKRLVEMNILTLDDLVRYTRIQLQQIVFSVLSWQQGAYQFVKDSPPQRLLSLDLDLTELVAAFILKRIEMNRIWEEIGSFQTVLTPCQDPERLAATGLTASQEKLLYAFDGHKDLQAVVSRYAGEHQDSLLKVVFYLLCADLLTSRKEPAESQPVEEAFDTVGLLYADEQEATGPATAPTRQLDDLSAETTDTEVNSEPEAEPAPEEEEEDELTDSLFPGEDHGKRRLSNWTYLMVLAVLVLAGTILMMVTRGEKEQVQPKPAPVVNLSEPSGEAMANEAPPKVDSGAQSDPAAVSDQAIPSRETGSTATQVEEPPKQTEKPRSEPVETVKPVPAGNDPWQLFHAGRIVEAGQVWADSIRNEGVRYSILLELDCQVESVRHAVDQFSDPGLLFILNRRRNERNCYLVMWGRFADEASAGAAYSSIPDYFLKQANPPKIIELAPYL